MSWFAPPECLKCVLLERALAVAVADRLCLVQKEHIGESWMLHYSISIGNALQTLEVSVGEILRGKVLSVSGGYSGLAARGELLGVSIERRSA